MSMTKHQTPRGFYRKETEGGRVVFAPDKYTRTLHDGFLESVGEIYYPNQFECVKRHIKNRFFLKLDLKDAFDSVNAIMAEVVLDLDFGFSWKYFFHEKGGLIQGAPASPAIFHLYCMEVLDSRIQEWCVLNNLAYSRFVDDILISSPRTSGRNLDRFGKKKRKVIRRIIKRARFQVNEQKSIAVDNKYTPIVYLGMQIFQNSVTPKKDFVEKIIAEPPGTRRYEGLEGWERAVIAVNRVNR